MGLKIDIIVAAIKAENKGYKLFNEKILKAYIRHKYKCSSYLANMVIKSLLETEDKPNEDEKTTD
jgi:hypothetical protein